MSEKLKHKHVAVAVVFDRGTNKFLLWNNPRWHGYAFPMKKFDPAAGDDPAQAAVQALAECGLPGNITPRVVEQADRLVETHFSEGTHQYTVYEYHVFTIALDPSINLETVDPDFRYFTFEELVAAVNVTAPTQSIVRDLIETRRVAVAVISRITAAGVKEYLLVANGAGKYFFPAARMKTDGLLVSALRHAISEDLGYDGEFTLGQLAEVPVLQASDRFGQREVKFYFYVCPVQFPGVELNVAKDLFHGKSKWFPAAQLGSGPDMSPSFELIRSAVLK